jgi:hypothetical protein
MGQDDKTLELECFRPCGTPPMSLQKHLVSLPVRAPIYRARSTIGFQPCPALHTAFFFPFIQRIVLMRFDYPESRRERWRARKRSIFFCASSKCPLDKCTYRCVVSRSACPISFATLNTSIPASIARVP